jgi:hypothetical protein
MDEYIKRNDAIEVLTGWETEPTDMDIKWALGCIPAEDVMEVVHGRWKLHDNGNGTCSVCNYISVHVWDFDNSLSFCPHCGAKMDGDLSG